jgi:hypothetical protein
MHVTAGRAMHKSTPRAGSAKHIAVPPPENFRYAITVSFPARSIGRFGETPGIAWLNSWSPLDDNTDFGRVVDKTLSPKRTKNVESL